MNDDLVTYELRRISDGALMVVYQIRAQLDCGPHVERTRWPALHNWPDDYEWHREVSGQREVIPAQNVVHVPANGFVEWFE